MTALLRTGALRLAAGLAFSVLAGAVAPGPLSAQQGDPREAAVIAVFQKLFDGMRTRDTTMMRSVFDPSAKLVRASTRDGRTAVQATSIDQFIAAIGRAPAGDQLIERIYAPEVRIDGNLATIWTFYTFHVGERFSHCGIDAAQLLETDEGWKIVHLADTTRRENCDPPGG